jgi:Protein of unknown function (DUF1353)
MSGERRLCLAYDPDESEDEWVLLEPYTRETSIGSITVPAGFRTDLASVPWQVWRKYPKFGRHIGAAVIHDWLYRTQPPDVERMQADAAFRDLLRRDGVRYGDVAVMHAAVREFGDSAWRRRKIA